MRGWRRAGLVVALGLLGSVAGGVKQAEACSCEAPGMLVPAPGAVGVPLDVRVVVAQSDGYLPAGSMFELRSAEDGSPVELALAPWTERVANIEGGWVATPAGPLGPATEYELHVLDEDGASAHVVGRFTTGTATSGPLPALGGVSAVSVRQHRSSGGCYDSCWARLDGTDEVILEHGPLPAGIAYAVVEIGPEDGGPASLFIRPAGEAATRTVVSSDYCAQRQMPILEEGRTYCARMRVVDHGGTSSEVGPRVCEAAETCAIRDCGRPSDGSCAQPGCSAAGRAGGTGAALLLLAALLLVRGGRCR